MTDASLAIAAGDVLQDARRFDALLELPAEVARSSIGDRNADMLGVPTAGALETVLSGAQNFAPSAGSPTRRSSGCCPS